MIFNLKNKPQLEPEDTKNPNTANNSSVHSIKTEKCVVCGRDTGVPFDTPISERKYYEPGSGQICETCYRKLYAKLPDSGKSFNAEMNALMKMCNNEEDGEK